MSQFHEFEVEETAFDRGVHALRLVLAFVWKFGIATAALAIVLNMVEGPSTDSKRPAAQASGQVQLVPPDPNDPQNTTYQLIARNSDPNALVHVKLIDTLGNHHMTLVYSSKGLIYSFSPEENGLRFGYSKNYSAQPDSERSFHLGSRAIHCKFSLKHNGETTIDLTEPNGEFKSIESIRVAPDGTILSSNREAECPKAD